MFNKLGLTIRTLKHLKWSQWFHLFTLAMRKWMYRIPVPLFQMGYTRAANIRVDQINELFFGSDQMHQLLGRDDRLEFQDEKLHFSFMHQTMTVDRFVNWAPADKSFLWQYNLHYFEYAYDLAVSYLKNGDQRAYEVFRRLVNEWITNNPCPKGLGWQPYPLSLRIVAWIKACHFFRELLAHDEPFYQTLVRSIFQQTLFLTANIERHLLNNHVIENGRALYLAGCFFSDRRARRWKKKGEKILLQELDRQVLEDGGQFERSPMYHAVVMLNYLDYQILKTFLGESLPESFQQTCRNMAQLYRHLVMPDDEIAFVNDAAVGMTVTSDKLFKVFQSAGWIDDQQSEGEDVVTLRESGFFIISDTSTKSKVMFDVGPMGPDFQPGHGHCDGLSVLWAWDQQRILIDSGVDDYYGNAEWRDYYRSTRAHNTIMINEQEQSEIWGNFRVGARAKPRLRAVSQKEDGITATADHDGYLRLPARVNHSRTIVYRRRGELFIKDVLAGATGFRFTSFFHLHPDFEIIPLQDGIYVAKGPAFHVMIVIRQSKYTVSIGTGSENPVQSWYSPEYGRRVSHSTLSISGTTERRVELVIGFITKKQSETAGELGISWPSFKL